MWQLTSPRVKVEREREEGDIMPFMTESHTITSAVLCSLKSLNTGTLKKSGIRLPL